MSIENKWPSSEKEKTWSFAEIIAMLLKEIQQLKSEIANWKWEMPSNKKWKPAKKEIASISPETQAEYDRLAYEHPWKTSFTPEEVITHDVAGPWHGSEFALSPKEWNSPDALKKAIAWLYESQKLHTDALSK